MLIKFETKSDRVKGLSFHLFRPWILASLHTGVIQLWDYRTSILLEKFTDHEGPVRGVSFHNQQPIFVSGGDDYKVKVWNYKQKKCMFTLLGHSDYVRTTVFHVEYPWIASASDDQTVRIWNWQSRASLCVLAGHNHYVMCASFHPKEDLLLSAALDQTVRVWDISGLHKAGKEGINIFASGCGVMKYLLEGHTRGVNWACFHHDMSLIASGGDDHQVKLWRYEEDKAWEVCSYVGHYKNVSSVVFHKKEDLLISNGEDRSLKVWDLMSKTCVYTFRRERDRFWMLSAHPSLNLLAAGHDTGMVIFKLERERPVFCLQEDTLYYVKNKTIRKFDSRNSKDVPIAYINNVNWNNPVRNISINAGGNSILICVEAKEGSYYELRDLTQSEVIYRRYPARAARWISKDAFVVIERNHRVNIRNWQNEIVTAVQGNCDETLSCTKPRTFALRNLDLVGLYDAQDFQVLAKIRIKRCKLMIWSPRHDHVVLVNKHQIYICDDSLRKLSTIKERVKIKSGAWDGDRVFVYTTTIHIKYALINGETGVIRTLDIPIYITTVRNGKIHCLDRECRVKIFSIDTTEYTFKLALLNQDYAKVADVIRNDKLVGQSIISYLNLNGYTDVALHFVKDHSTSFELALKCGNLQIALKSAYGLNDRRVWLSLADVALQLGYLDVAEVAYKRADCVDKLFFLYLITGSFEKLRILGRQRGASKEYHAALLLGDVAARMRVLSDAKKHQLAYLTAVNHGFEKDAEDILKSHEEVSAFINNGAAEDCSKPHEESSGFISKINDAAEDNLKLHGEISASAKKNRTNDAAEDIMKSHEDSSTFINNNKFHNTAEEILEPRGEVSAFAKKNRSNVFAEDILKSHGETTASIKKNSGEVSASIKKNKSHDADEDILKSHEKVSASTNKNISNDAAKDILESRRESSTIINNNKLHDTAEEILEPRGEVSAFAKKNRSNVFAEDILKSHGETTASIKKNSGEVFASIKKNKSHDADEDILKSHEKVSASTNKNISNDAAEDILKSRREYSTIINNNKFHNTAEAILEPRDEVSASIKNNRSNVSAEDILKSHGEASAAIKRNSGEGSASIKKNRSNDTDEDILKSHGKVSASINKNMTNDAAKDILKSRRESSTIMNNNTFFDTAEEILEPRGEVSAFTKKNRSNVFAEDILKSHGEASASIKKNSSKVSASIKKYRSNDADEDILKSHGKVSASTNKNISNDAAEDILKSRRESSTIINNNKFHDTAEEILEPRDEVSASIKKTRSNDAVEDILKSQGESSIFINNNKFHDAAEEILEPRGEISAFVKKNRSNNAAEDTLKSHEEIPASIKKNRSNDAAEDIMKSRGEPSKFINNNKFYDTAEEILEPRGGVSAFITKNRSNNAAEYILKSREEMSASIKKYNDAAEEILEPRGDVSVSIKKNISNDAAEDILKSYGEISASTKKNRTNDAAENILKSRGEPSTFINNNKFDDTAEEILEPRGEVSAFITKNRSNNAAEEILKSHGEISASIKKDRSNDAAEDILKSRGEISASIKKNRSNITAEDILKSHREMSATIKKYNDATEEILEPRGEVSASIKKNISNDAAEDILKSYGKFSASAKKNKSSNAAEDILKSYEEFSTLINNNKFHDTAEEIFKPRGGVSAFIETNKSNNAAKDIKSHGEVSAFIDKNKFDDAAEDILNAQEEASAFMDDMDDNRSDDDADGILKSQSSQCFEFVKQTFRNYHQNNIEDGLGVLSVDGLKHQEASRECVGVEASRIATRQFIEDEENSGACLKPRANAREGLIAATIKSATSDFLRYQEASRECVGVEASGIATREFLEDKENPGACLKPPANAREGIIAATIHSVSSDSLRYQGASREGVEASGIVKREFLEDKENSAACLKPQATDGEGIVAATMKSATSDILRYQEKSLEYVGGEYSRIATCQFLADEENLGTCLKPQATAAEGIDDAAIKSSTSGIPCEETNAHYHLCASAEDTSKLPENYKEGQHRIPVKDSRISPGNPKHGRDICVKSSRVSLENQKCGLFIRSAEDTSNFQENFNEGQRGIAVKASNISPGNPKRDRGSAEDTSKPQENFNEGQHGIVVEASRISPGNPKHGRDFGAKSSRDSLENEKYEQFEDTSNLQENFNEGQYRIAAKASSTSPGNPKHGGGFAEDTFKLQENFNEGQHRIVAKASRISPGSPDCGKVLGVKSSRVSMENQKYGQFIRSAEDTSNFQENFNEGQHGISVKALNMSPGNPKRDRGSAEDTFKLQENYNEGQHRIVSRENLKYDGDVGVKFSRTSIKNENNENSERYRNIEDSDKSDSGVSTFFESSHHEENTENAQRMDEIEIPKSDRNSKIVAKHKFPNCKNDISGVEVSESERNLQTVEASDISQGFPESEKNCKLDDISGEGADVENLTTPAEENVRGLVDVSKDISTPQLPNEDSLEARTSAASQFSKYESPKVTKDIEGMKSCARFVSKDIPVPQLLTKDSAEPQTSATSQFPKYESAKDTKIEGMRTCMRVSQLRQQFEINSTAKTDEEEVIALDAYGNTIGGSKIIQETRHINQDLGKPTNVEAIKTEISEFEKQSQMIKGSTRDVKLEVFQNTGVATLETSEENASVADFSQPTNKLPKVEAVSIEGLQEIPGNALVLKNVKQFQVIKGCYSDEDVEDLIGFEAVATLHTSKGNTSSFPTVIKGRYREDLTGSEAMATLKISEENTSSFETVIKGQYREDSIGSKDMATLQTSEEITSKASPNAEGFSKHGFLNLGTDLFRKIAVTALKTASHGLTEAKHAIFDSQKQNTGNKDTKIARECTKQGLLNEQEELNVKAPKALQDFDDEILVESRSQKQVNTGICKENTTRLDPKNSPEYTKQGLLNEYEERNVTASKTFQDLDNETRTLQNSQKCPNRGFQDVSDGLDNSVESEESLSVQKSVNMDGRMLASPGNTDQLSNKKSRSRMKPEENPRETDQHPERKSIQPKFLSPPPPIQKLFSNWPLLNVNRGFFEKSLGTTIGNLMNTEAYGVSEEPETEIDSNEKPDCNGWNTEEQTLDLTEINQSTVCNTEGTISPTKTLKPNTSNTSLTKTSSPSRSRTLLPKPGKGIDFKIPGHHARLGDYETALDLLHSQAGVVNFEPYRELLKEIFATCRVIQSWQINLRPRFVDINSFLFKITRAKGKSRKRVTDKEMLLNEKWSIICGKRPEDPRSCQSSEKESESQARSGSHQQNLERKMFGEEARGSFSSQQQNLERRMFAEETRGSSSSHQQNLESRMFAEETRGSSGSPQQNLERRMFGEEARGSSSSHQQNLERRMFSEESRVSSRMSSEENLGPSSSHQYNLDCDSQIPFKKHSTTPSVTPKRYLDDSDFQIQTVLLTEMSRKNNLDSYQLKSRESSEYPSEDNRQSKWKRHDSGCRTPDKHLETEDVESPVSSEHHLKTENESKSKDFEISYEHRLKSAESSKQNLETRSGILHPHDLLREQHFDSGISSEHQVFLDQTRIPRKPIILPRHEHEPQASQQDLKTGISCKLNASSTKIPSENYLKTRVDSDSGHLSDHPVSDDFKIRSQKDLSCKNYLTRQNHRFGSTYLLTVQELIKKTQTAYQLTTNGKFETAIVEFQKIILQTTLVMTKQCEETIAADLRQISSNYILGLKMEVHRRSLPKTTREHQKKQCELSAYFTHFNLLTIHKICTLRMALNICFKAKNYKSALRFAKRLLALGPSSEIAALANKMVLVCQQDGADGFEFDYDESRPFVVCGYTFKPIYNGFPVVKCYLCGCSYFPEFRGFVCNVCIVAEIGFEGSGLKVRVC